VSGLRPAPASTRTTDGAPHDRRRRHRGNGAVFPYNDERMVAVAKLAYRRGAYGYAFFED
jgi:hypothetical protein